VGGVSRREPILSTMVLNQSAGRGEIRSDNVVIAAGTFSAQSALKQLTELRIPDKSRSSGKLKNSEKRCLCCVTLTFRYACEVDLY
jgi:hypothetical protein